MSASSSASTSRRLAPWLLALALAGACGSSAIPHPTEADAQWAQTRWPGTTGAQLAEGRDLYVRKCGGCHTLYEPSHVVRVDWPATFDEMSDRAKMADPERERVRHYLTAITRRE
jgi:cytochrome c5